jgi:hypothetical protein
MDKLTKGITLAVTLLFVTVMITVQLSLNHEPRGELVVISTAVFLLFVYMTAYIYRPLNYELNGEALIINRPLKRVIIPRQDIEYVEPMDDDAMKGTIRLFGVGGFFGYYGVFVNSRQGRMTWYATRKNNMILVKTRSNEKIVLTPDEPVDFLRQFSR